MLRKKSRHHRRIVAQTLRSFQIITGGSFQRQDDQAVLPSDAIPNNRWGTNDFEDNATEIPSRSPSAQNDRSDSFEDDEDQAFSGSKTNNLMANLRSWALTHNVTHCAVSDLLKVLNSSLSSTGLPNDARCLLKTPRYIQQREVCPGVYCHFPLTCSLEKNIEDMHDLQHIFLDIKTNGQNMASANFGDRMVINLKSNLLARQKANRSEKVTDISSSGERGRGKRERTTNLPASSPKKIRKRKQLQDNLSSSESDTNNNTVWAGLKIPTLKRPTGIENNFGGIFNNPRSPNLIRSSGVRSRETSVELDDAIDTVPVPGRTYSQRLHSPVASCSTDRPQTSQNFVSISLETLQTLVQSVELIKVRQKHYGDLLEFLSSKLDHMPQGLPEKRTQAIKLPLRTMTELDELERAMTNDDIAAELYGLLFGIGGNSVGDTTRNCLAKLVSNNVAANLNWKGRGNKQGGIEKRGFGDFRICQTLSRSVFEFYKRKQSLTNIEKAIKDWLKQAPYRKNGGGLISEQQQETTENSDC
ncbi:unnamed protein product [Allacma fusca]|uniref:DUF4806 domain-containing protein n=1 Tax=Allacma fusca TaxID=39272 RepID=A0A8J2PWT7_9HEXA|nr:unnamed protein product [Allacma fusca]